jgi:hypothetical protein
MQEDLGGLGALLFGGGKSMIFFINRYLWDVSEVMFSYVAR